MSKSKSNENEEVHEGQFIVLSLGSNIGGRMQFLEDALRALYDESGIHLFDHSAVYETQPVDDVDQPFFLNLVVTGRTELQPGELLRSVKQIEQKLGRKKRRDKGPREIDIDIIFYGDEVIDEPDLKIPHPQFQRRKFVLVPLIEMIPGFISPVHDKPIAELLDSCPDESYIQLYEHLT